MSPRHRPITTGAVSASLCRGTYLPVQTCRQAPQGRHLDPDLPLQLPRYLFGLAPLVFRYPVDPAYGCGRGALFCVGRSGTCANAGKVKAIAPAIATIISGAFMGEILDLAVFGEPKKHYLVPEGQGLILRHIAFGRVPRQGACRRTRLGRENAREPTLG